MVRLLGARKENLKPSLMPFVFACALLSGLAAQEPTYQGITLKEWLVRYRTGKEDARREAFRAFQKMGEVAKPIVPELIASLKDHVDRGESMLLIELGAVAVPLLAETLDDQRTYYGKVPHLLEAMDADAVPAIVEAAAVAPPKRRLVLIDILGRMGRKAQSASASLRRWLRADDPECKLCSAIALAHIDCELNRESFPVLFEFVNGGNTDYREKALRALSVGLEQSLSRMTWSETEDRAFDRIAATLDVEGKTYVELLDALSNVQRVVPGRYDLDRESSDVQLDAVHLARQKELLTRLRKEVLPKVAQLMSHSDGQVRATAIGGVGRFGVEARPWLDELLGILHRRDGCEEYVLKALKSMGESGRDAIDDLRALIDDEQELIRKLALDALYGLEPDEVRRLARRGKTQTGQSARQVLFDRNDQYLKKLYKPPGTLAIDRHNGYTGFQAKDNIYRLEAEEPVTVNQTILRFQARGDRGSDTRGRIEMSRDGKDWTLIARWDPKMIEASARERHWHQLKLESVPADWSTDTLLVRFSYESGKEQLNISAVHWEPITR